MRETIALALFEGDTFTYRGEVYTATHVGFSRGTAVISVDHPDYKLLMMDDTEVVHVH